ncbi:hypothetical protein WA026_021112 [Henosepilachna vigintioctopunctata]|uniref:Uncharacterized protein n=1 Tax=Henosepilachna vigintioctopunctata TaxID=420089 RepID=A0AAW1UUV7_9CUCU
MIGNSPTFSSIPKSPHTDRERSNQCNITSDTSVLTDCALSLFLLYSALCVYNTDARRIRVRPSDEEEQQEDTVHYYAAEPQDDNQQQVVYVSSADQYNGLYGQPTASSRASQAEYIPRSKQSNSISLSRTKEPAKAPPVQTIRNYNKVNDDGSFTFGYEAADGSFKEETRGTDCVVRGKYGYVDPDGNKREFTYVSGNPCDPNAPKDDEQQEEPESNEREIGPANYPTRPIRPVRPVSVTPSPKPVTLFQNSYDQGEEEQPEPEQVLRQHPIRRPTTYTTRPQYVQPSDENSPPFQRAQHFASTTPAPFVYRQSVRPVSITPRPISASTSHTQLPATTYRPQLLQVAVTPRPSIVYTKGLSSASSTAAPIRGNVDFDTEFQRFQADNHISSPTPATLTKTTPTITKQSANPGRIYSSALVYDPSTGQYDTQLYQTLPHSQGDFSLNHRIQPYVAQPQRPQQVNIQQLQSQSPLYSQLRAQHQQLYQQQQAEAQFQNSAQLYAQQQKARTQQQQQPQQQPQLHPQQRQPAHQFYYVQPQDEQEGGHLSAFLRGHNIQF